MLKSVDEPRADGSRGNAYPWCFRRVGGVDQVVLRHGGDIKHIPELDQKLWLSLCMPTRGIALDPRTADLIDTDHDDRIRPPELIAAIRWCSGVFADLGCIIKGGDCVTLANVQDAQVLAGAKRILQNLGKGDVDSITLADVNDRAAIFANTRFNGDGIVPADATDDAAVSQAISEIIKLYGATKDRSGKDGLDARTVDQFQTDARNAQDWYARGRTLANELPLDLAAMASALAAVQHVRAKIDDFFTRCRVVGFDERAASVLNGDVADYKSFTDQALSATAEEMQALPLAHVTPDLVLPLMDGVNPAWCGAIQALRERVREPLFQDGSESLSISEWEQIKKQLNPYQEWISQKPVLPVMALDEPRLEALSEPTLLQAIRDLIAKDAELKAENDQIGRVEQMILYQRDMYEILTNYVNFADFYSHTYAVFQAGSLYIDGRACHLCVDVVDVAKHTTMAGLSNAFLVYCDVIRGREKRCIAAVVTDGDSLNLAVGRNGVFYDRNGTDWSATITRIVANPISIREAFWLPYRKCVRLIEEQIAKRAQAAEAASMARMNQAATTVTTADQAKGAELATPAGSKKIELGAIALIGTAIGGLSALVAGFLQVLFGLGIWLPLGVLGLIMLISGPSMLLAAIKLKQRNLGPILDANGWAINTRAKMNPAFGAALTALARLPPGASRSFDDPFPTKRFNPWRMGLLLAVFGVLFYVWLNQL